MKRALTTKIWSSICTLAIISFGKNSKSSPRLDGWSTHSVIRRPTQLCFLSLALKHCSSRGWVQMSVESCRIIRSQSSFGSPWVKNMVQVNKYWLTFSSMTIIHHLDLQLNITKMTPSSMIQLICDTISINVAPNYKIIQTLWLICNWPKIMLWLWWAMTSLAQTNTQTSKNLTN